jgi:hypothetical protein
MERKQWAVYNETNGRFMTYDTLEEAVVYIADHRDSNGDKYLMKILAVIPIMTREHANHNAENGNQF